MSRRERRSVSLGRHRDRGPRDHSKAPEEDLSTRHNISNFLLTLQRVQASEEENRQLRKENQLLRQRTRSSRLSSGSFRGHNSYDSIDPVTIVPDAEDEIIAADVKRNSLIFVGDTAPPSPEHAALEAQYKKLQEDFETVKEFLKHLFQHALTMSSSDTRPSFKDGKENYDVNTFNPSRSKHFEHSLEDIHGQISQLRNSQDQQQIKMEQVQQALDNVLCQSSVRNDVTMRIVRQQDKMKEITRHANFLEAQLISLNISIRQAEEKSRQTVALAQSLENFITVNNKNLKGNTKDELYKFAEHLSKLGKQNQTCMCKMACVSKLVSHVIVAANQGETLADNKPPADVVDAMSKLERLIGSDWHRLGRMFGLSSDCLDDIGKFTNFDLTSRVEKVVICWARQTRGANAEGLSNGLDKMDRDILLIAEQPLCKDWMQLPPEISTYVIAHLTDAPSIVSYLASQGIISQDNRAFILGASQEHRRAGRLLQSVVYMGPPALSSLCAALNKHDQSLVADKIRGCLPSQYQTSDSNLNSLTLDHNNRSTAHREKSPNSSMPSGLPPRDSSSKTPSKSTTSMTGTNSKPNEKQRKKRSRSLFTRKNKLRDSELDTDLAVDVQGDYNYYYPVASQNTLNKSLGHGTRSDHKDHDSPAGSTRRQYGRQGQAVQGTHNNDGVIV